MEDSNNNCLTSHSKSQDSSYEALFKTGKRKADSEKQLSEEQERKGEQNENQEKDQQENQNISENKVSTKKIKIQEGKLDNSVSKKKNDHSDRKSRDGDSRYENKNLEGTPKSRSDYREIMKNNSDSGRRGSEKESNKKSRPSKESSKEGKESFPFDSSNKYSKMIKLVNITDEKSPRISRSSEVQNKKRKNSSTERHEHKQESENDDHSKHKIKMAKIKHKDRDYDSEQQEPSMSFESYLNYDVNLFKRKERQVKYPPKKIKNEVKEQARKDPGMKSFKSPVKSIHVTSPKQVYLIYIL